MSDHHGLANRCLQPLGHISERGNHYSFGASGSNRGSESAESSESKGERRGPERGPTPASRYAVEWAAIPSRATGQSVPTGADGGAKPCRRIEDAHHDLFAERPAPPKQEAMFFDSIPSPGTAAG